MEEKKRAIEMKKVEKEALQAQFKQSLEKEKREEHRKSIKSNIESMKKQDEQRKE